MKINEVTEGKKHTLQIFTDENKNELGVSFRITIFLGNELTRELKIKLNKKCTNNQAEQLVIAKALEQWWPTHGMHATRMLSEWHTQSHYIQGPAEIIKVFEYIIFSNFAGLLLLMCGSPVKLTLEISSAIHISLSNKSVSHGALDNRGAHLCC